MEGSFHHFSPAQAQDGVRRHRSTDESVRDWRNDRKIAVLHQGGAWRWPWWTCCASLICEYVAPAYGTHQPQELRRMPGSGVDFNGDIQACDVCAVGKSKQQTHPKRATYDVQHAFQLVTVDVMRPIKPAALGDYSYVTSSS